MVTVDDGVRLEVLDWGGSGRPIVLLGGYTTAHIFDDIAPKSTHAGHVYGITRRGLGTSRRPASGYTTPQSGQDILRVLEALKLDKPVLMGFSFGGRDLHWIGAEHSERVGALVYLDSAEDGRLWPATNGPLSSETNDWRARLPKDPLPNMSSIAAYRAWQRANQDMSFPESELRQLFALNENGSLGEYQVLKQVRDALHAGHIEPDYKRRAVPVLAFFELPAPLADQLKKYQPEGQMQAAALGARYVMNQVWPAVNAHALKSALPGAKIVFLRDANTYIFLTNESDIVRETSAFMGELR